MVASSVMVSLDDLPNFSGDDGEDASWWLKSFVVATSAYNDGAVLRMFPNYLEPDSLAQRWYNGLPDDEKATWNAIDSKFRQQWASGPAEQTRRTEERNAEKFRNHRLTEDDIFGLPSLDLEGMNKVIVDWARSHAQIGAAAKLDDPTLIQITMQHIPAFLRAFLKYKSRPPPTFQALCTGITEITDEVLEFEKLRRHEKNWEWMNELLDMVKEHKQDNNRPSRPNGTEGKLDTAAATAEAKEDATTPRLGVVRVGFTQLINTDKGSGASADLATWKPQALEKNWYYLGPAATNSSKTPGFGLIVQEIVPHTLADIDSWSQVWNDKGSVNSTDYALWRGACRNPNYIALASYFTRSHNPPSADETKGMKAVHRSVLTQAIADREIWTDVGSGAGARSAVWHVSGGGNESAIETGAFFAVHGLKNLPVDVFGINAPSTQIGFSP